VLPSENVSKCRDAPSVRLVNASLVGQSDFQAQLAGEVAATYAAIVPRRTPHRGHSPATPSFPVGPLGSHTDLHFSSWFDHDVSSSFSWDIISHDHVLHASRNHLTQSFRHACQHENPHPTRQREGRQARLSIIRLSPSLGSAQVQSTQQIPGIHQIHSSL